MANAARLLPKQPVKSYNEFLANDGKARGGGGGALACCCARARVCVVVARCVRAECRSV